MQHLRTSTGPAIPFASKPYIPQQDDIGTQRLTSLSPFPTVIPITTVPAAVRVAPSEADVQVAVRLWRHTAQETDSYLARMIEFLDLVDDVQKRATQAQDTGLGCSAIWLKARREEEAALGNVFNMIVAHRRQSRGGQ